MGKMNGIEVNNSDNSSIPIFILESKDDQHETHQHTERSSTKVPIYKGKIRSQCNMD